MTALRLESALELIAESCTNGMGLLCRPYYNIQIEYVYMSLRIYFASQLTGVHCKAKVSQLQVADTFRFNSLPQQQ